MVLVVVLEILIVSFLRGVSQPEILAFNYIFYTLLYVIALLPYGQLYLPPHHGDGDGCVWVDRVRTTIRQQEIRNWGHQKF